MADTDFPVDDFGSIEVTESDWTAPPTVDGLVGGVLGLVDQPLPLLGSTVAPVGSSVCRSGGRPRASTAAPSCPGAPR